MSAEIITTVLTAASLMIAMFTAIGANSAWLIKRMDERFNKVDHRFEKIDERFEKVDERFQKVDQKFETIHQQINVIRHEFNDEFKVIGTQIHQLRSELNTVKVAVARLEGPHQRLILPPQ